ncbi:MAG TPA: alpha/beta fold hydrolase [Thermoanaerobaculia bacterium]|nr:alpha/beta fold hydrolase [Thermoanaerobaculia bacterium]
MRLIRFRSSDGLGLPGLLYEPSRESREAALFLHGNGDASVFYSATRTNAFGEEMTRRGISLFAFDNRGAHLIKRLSRKTARRSGSVLLGMTYEKIRDCVADVDGAIAMLRSEGYRRFHLIGHSTGANKICVYNARKRRNPVARVVLLAPGDDVGIHYEALGPRRFARTLKTARARVAAGRGRELAPPSVSPFLISWSSLLDTIDPDGDYNVFPFLETMRDLGLSRRPLFRHYRRLRKPTLALLGERDEFCFGEVDRCAGLLRDHAAEPRRFSSIVLSGADHGFHGAEHEAGAAMASFLASGRG